MAASARFEYDLYRPTHFFPFRPMWKLYLLSRLLLSVSTVMVYPVQVRTAWAGKHGVLFGAGRGCSFLWIRCVVCALGE